MEQCRELDIAIATTAKGAMGIAAAMRNTIYAGLCQGLQGSAPANNLPQTMSGGGGVSLVLQGARGQ